MDTGGRMGLDQEDSEICAMEVTRMQKILNERAINGASGVKRKV
jgi:hypothetical protein